jgi:AraC family transcriptional regulator
MRETQPEIRTIGPRLFAGKKVKMSYTENKTFEVWGSFMPTRNTIVNGVGIELYSIEIYPTDFFRNFNPGAFFEKWAAVEVSDFDSLPADMATLVSPGGLYAVFNYKGMASEAPAFYQYIFNSWLPASGYQLDNRPHFAVMGEKYKNNDPNSEEELCVPVKEK